MFRRLFSTRWFIYQHWLLSHPWRSSCESAHPHTATVLTRVRVLEARSKFHQSNHTALAYASADLQLGCPFPSGLYSVSTRPVRCALFCQDKLCVVLVLNWFACITGLLAWVWKRLRSAVMADVQAAPTTSLMECMTCVIMYTSRSYRRLTVSARSPIWQFDRRRIG